MEFEITLRGRKDLTRQVYRQMRAAILNGRLRSGERLPSTRSLAAQVSLARKTIMRAYDLLYSESLVTGTPGSGTYVASNIAALRKPGSSRSMLSPRPVWANARRSTAAPEPATPRFDLRMGVPDTSMFPHALWRSLLAGSSRVLGDLEARYGNAQGDARLRAAIARYIAFTRAVVCDADQIIITHGAQQAFDLIARVLLNPGDVTAVEEPGYQPARRLFHSHGFKVKAVPVDAAGICTARLPGNARLVYVTPSHQYPLGMPMSLERKLSLLRWAAEHRACVLEDDYDSEFRFEPRPLEALQSLDRYGLVVYVGTFAKALHPGIRIGFIVAPRTLVPALAEARRLTDWYEPLAPQVALARFITEGHLARHVRRMSKIYARRRAVLLESLAKWKSVFGQVVPSVTGMHLTCLVKNDERFQSLLRRAKRKGVALNSPIRLPSQQTMAGLALGYGRIPEEQIPAAIESMVR